MKIGAYHRCARVRSRRREARLFERCADDAGRRVIEWPAPSLCGPGGLFPGERTRRRRARSSRSPAKATACEHAGNPPRTPNRRRGSIPHRRYGFKSPAPFPDYFRSAEADHEEAEIRVPIRFLPMVIRRRVALRFGIHSDGTEGGRTCSWTDRITHLSVSLDAFSITA